MNELHSSSDFKSGECHIIQIYLINDTDISDILAVLELNEASYIAGDEENAGSKEGYFTIACEIRARLLQALNKATHFFENNLELLATIAQLKREAATQMNAARHTEEVI